MQGLQLDYQRTRRAVPWPALALLLVAVAVLAALGAHGRALESQAASLEARARRLQGSAVAAAPRAVPARAQAQEVLQANQVVRELALPWGALFKAVDTAAGKDVALLALEPDLRKGSIRISGEARNLPALLEYVRVLARSEGLDGVVLESHQIRHEEAEKPVRFALAARWKEPAP